MHIEIYIAGNRYGDEYWSSKEWKLEYVRDDIELVVNIVPDVQLKLFWKLVHWMIMK